MSALSPEDFDLLAAEHVLGLLDGADAARAEDLARSDPAFMGAVRHWQERFAELDFSAPSRPLPAELFARISNTLDAGAAPEPEVAVKTVPAPGQAHAPDRQVFSGWLQALWASLGFWRTAGFAGAAATLLLALSLAFGPFARAPQPQMVAVLLGPQGEPAAVVNAFADGTADLIPLRSISVPEGRVLEVWTLWDPARGPVSIGLTSESRRIRLDLKNLPRTAPNQLFEITLEPQGGSPIGRPTGPILMKGTTSVAL